MNFIKSTFSLKNIQLRDFNNLFVGAFITATVFIFLIITVLTLEEKNFFAPTYSLYCDFNKGLGLNRGTAVQVNGVEVGQVDSIGLTPAGTVRLKLKIRSSAQLHITAASEVFATRDKNVISDRIIYITHGNTGEPLKNGDKLKTANSQDIEAVLEQVNQLLGRIDRIVIVADTLLKMAVNPKSTVGALLGSRDLYDQVDQRLQQVGTIADQTSDFLGQVYGKSIPLMDRLDSISRVATHMIKKGDKSMDQVNLLLGTANSTFTDAQKLLNQGKILLEGSEDKLNRADELIKGVGSMWLIRGTLPKKDSVQLLQENAW